MNVSLSKKTQRTALKHQIERLKRYQDNSEKDTKNEVENLDKWLYDNKKKLVENADEEDDMEEDTTVLKDQDIAERLMIPEIDYQALDMIGRDGTINDIDEKKTKRIQPQFRVKSHSTAAIEKMTGMETMKNDLNKQILNEVLSRKLENFQFPSDQEKRVPPKTRAKILANDTINRFQTLRGVFQGTKFQGYDQVVDIINNKKKTSEQEKNKIVFEKNMHEYKKLDFEECEKALHKKYLEAITEAKSRQERIEDLREENLETKLAIDRARVKLDLELQKLREEEAKVRKSHTKPSKKKNNQFNQPALEKDKNLNLEGFMLLNEIKEKVNQVQSHFAEHIRLIEGGIHKNNDDIERFDNEISNIKMRKVVFRYKLKELYVGALKSCSELRLIGKRYTDIVRALWNIKEEVHQKLFPDSVDFELFQFILNLGELEQKLVELKELKQDVKKAEMDTRKNSTISHMSMLKPLNLSSPKMSISSGEVKFRSKYSRSNSQNYKAHSSSMAHIHLEDPAQSKRFRMTGFDQDVLKYQEKLQELKRCNLTMKQKVLVKRSRGMPPIIKWEDYEPPEENQSQLPQQFFQDHAATNNLKHFNREQEIESKIKELKDSQIRRLMKSYDSRTIDDRVISEFEDQMFVLFGKKETEVIMNNFLREKQISQHEKNVHQLTNKRPGAMNKPTITLNNFIKDFEATKRLQKGLN